MQLEDIMDACMIFSWDSCYRVIWRVCFLLLFYAEQ